MEFNRNCPICKKRITYKTLSQYNNARICDRNCKSCSNKVRITKATKNNIKYSKKCTTCGNENIFSSYIKYKNSKPIEIYKCKSCATSLRHSGKLMSEGHKQLISECVKNGWRVGKYNHAVKLSSERWTGDKNPMYKSNRRGELNPFYKKHHTQSSIDKMKQTQNNMSCETKQKMSSAAKHRCIRLGNPRANYNPKAIVIIEQYGKENGYKFQHAENGGEYKIMINNRWYFLDGYDKKNNTAIEYYEMFHKYRIDKDEIRKAGIINKLNCNFIEIKEWN